MIAGKIKYLSGLQVYKGINLSENFVTQFFMAGFNYCNGNFTVTMMMICLPLNTCLK